MRKAISFSGQPRFIWHGYRLLKENLENFKEYDIFVHTWADTTPEQLLKLYKPKEYIWQPQIDPFPPVVPHERSRNYFNHYSMFYSMKRSLDLVNMYEEKHGFQYDMIIRTRFDIALLDPLSAEDFSLKVMNATDSCGNPLVISDWFNWSGRENMEKFREMYGKLPEYYEKGVKIDSGEEIIVQNLRENHIATSKVGVRLYLIRDRSCAHLAPTWIYEDNLPE